VHVKSGDSDTLEFRRFLAVRDGKLEMVVKVVLVVLETSVRRRRLETNGLIR
jgi:hypothetical protein